MQSIKVEIFLEQREVAFLSPSIICDSKFEFFYCAPLKIQIFRKFCLEIRTQPICSKIISTLPHYDLPPWRLTL